MDRTIPTLYSFMHYYYVLVYSNSDAISHKDNDILNSKLAPSYEISLFSISATASDLNTQFVNRLRNKRYDT